MFFVFLNFDLFPFYDIWSSISGHFLGYFCPLTSYRSHVLAQEPNENMILRNISRNDLRAFFEGLLPVKRVLWRKSHSFKYRNTTLVMHALYDVEKRIILIYIFYDIKAWWPKSHNFGIWIFSAGHFKPKVSSAAWCCACWNRPFYFESSRNEHSSEPLRREIGVFSVFNLYVPMCVFLSTG